MFSVASFVASILAQGSPAAENPCGDPSFMFLMVGMFAVLYFFMIRPQRKAQQQQQEMLSALKKNDRVVTQAGIFGLVDNVKPDSNKVTIKIDEKTGARMEVLKSTITQVINDEEAEEATDRAKAH